MMSTSGSAQSPEDHMRRGNEQPSRAGMAPGRAIAISLRTRTVVRLAISCVR